MLRGTGNFNFFDKGGKMTRKEHSKIRKDPIFLRSRFNKLNRIIGKVETEFEDLFKKLIRQGEKSSKELKRNFDEILSRLKKTDLYTRAKETRGDLKRELHRLSGDILSKVKGLELGPSHFSGKKLLKDGRKNIDIFINKLEKTGVVSLAKNTAENTRDGMLSFLSIPSQSEVVKLERKVITLEKKVHTLSKKAA